MKNITTKIIAVIIILGCTNGKSQVEEAPKIVTISDTTKTKETIIDIVAVGDMMLGTNFPDKSTLPPNEGRSLLEYAQPYIQEATVSFGNVEGTLLDSGGKSKGVGKNIYNFRQPVAYAKILKSTGFDLLSIANNHINDFGITGIESTIKTLRENDFAFAGTPSVPYCVIERKGVKIGMIAFAPHSGCLNMLKQDEAVKLVKELKAKVDLVIISIHGGAEGSGASHVTRKDEVFLNFNRGNIYAFSHAVIDAGADMIIGHGPHVPRGIELYKSKIIAYSLGNFCTYAKFNLKGISGLAPMLMAKLDTKGNFIEGKIISFKQPGQGGPVPDSSNQAAMLIEKLSKEDFPESKLIFKNNTFLNPENNERTVLYDTVKHNLL